MRMRNRERNYAWLNKRLQELRDAYGNDPRVKDAIDLFLRGFAFGDHSVYWLR